MNVNFIVVAIPIFFTFLAMIPKASSIYKEIWGKDGI